MKQTMARGRAVISGLLKVSVAAGLIFWLVDSGRLDITSLGALLTSRHLGILFVLTFLTVFINNVRWKVLLQSQNFPCSNSSTLPLTLIGLFFNYAMPGGVGGDVVKGYYLLQDHRDRKLAAATSIFMDRLVGFYVMTFLGVVALLFDVSEILKRPALVTLSFILFGLFVGFNFLFLFAFSRRVSKHPFLSWVFLRIPGGHKLELIYRTIHEYRGAMGAFFQACFLSMGSQISMILFFTYVGGILSGGVIPWQTYALVVPVGMIVTALPISLAGIGVGQVVFTQLFNWNLGYDTPVAAAVVTAYQIAIFGWGLFGVYFYLKRKRPTELLDSTAEA